MDKKRLLELAGINEQHAVSDAAMQMADMFEKTMDGFPVEQSDADEWADAGQTLMAELHEELKQRGLLG